MIPHYPPTSMLYSGSAGCGIWGLVGNDCTPERVTAACDQLATGGPLDAPDCIPAGSCRALEGSGVSWGMQRTVLR